MSKKFGIIITLSLLFLTSFYVGKANAAVCSSGNLFLTRQGDIVWGDTPINAAPSNVSATPNSSVRLSVSGEDGCAGQNVTFQIVEKTANTFSGKLTLGKQILSGTPSRPTVFQLYYDWTNNLPIGSYTFKTILPISAGPSANKLIIESNAQACRLLVVNTTPPQGTKFGTPIQVNVTAQGTCQEWGVKVNIYETTGGRNTLIPSAIAEQKFPVGSNQLTFSWNPVRDPGAGLQASYKADAVLGSQTLSSNPFIVSGVGGGGGGCSTPGQPACKPGQTQTTYFNIPNPLKGGVTDFSSLVKIIAEWIFNLAIPIAVAMIVYSGILFLTAGGEPAKVTKAKDVLKYAVIGLAIILIGSGFISLIRSILELGGNTPAP